LRACGSSKPQQRTGQGESAALSRKCAAAADPVGKLCPERPEGFGAAAANFS